MKCLRNVSFFILTVMVYIGLIYPVYAIEIGLEVDWIPQHKLDEGLGTDYNNTKICGPTSAEMQASYVRNFYPTIPKLKTEIDWMVDVGLYPDVNNYDGYNTDYRALQAIASYYYGLWNHTWKKPNAFGSENDHLNAIRNSLQAGRPVVLGTYTNMMKKYCEYTDETTGNIVTYVCNGHFMVITKIRDTDDDGIWDDIFVNDPGRNPNLSPSEHQRWYSVSQLTNAWQGSLFFYDNYGVGEYNNGWHSTGNYSGYSEDSPKSQPFVDFYVNSGLDESDTTSPRGPDVLGYPTTKVIQYPQFDDFFNVYNIFQTWVQDYYNQPSGDSYTLVLNPNSINDLDDWGVAFAVHSRIRDYWRSNYWSLGYPVCNEYYDSNGVNNYAIQWFADGYGFKRKVALNLSTNVVNDSGSDCFEIGDRDTIDKAKNQGYQKTGYNQGSYLGSGGGVDPIEDDPEEDDDYTYDSTTIGIGIESGDEAWSQRIVHEQNEFYGSDKISVVLKLLDLKADFKLRYEVYRDGESFFDFSTDTLIVDSEYGWAYSYIPVFEDADFLAGDYSLQMFIISDGEEAWLDALNFQVFKDRLDFIYTSEESTICEDVGSGVEPWSMVAINPKTVFTNQEKATLLIGIKDVFINHRFKVVVSRNGEYYWEYTEANWRVVDSTWGWSYSYFNPSQSAGALAGEYRFDVYLDTGAGFYFLDSREFTVGRISPDYVFVGAEMCKGYQAGPADWSWAAVEPTNVFKKGVDEAKCLVTFENVYVDVRFKNDVYYKEDGVWKLFWESGATNWYGIEPENRRDFVYYMPSQSTYVPARDYQFRIFFDKGDGFKALQIMEFSVVE